LMSWARLWTQMLKRRMLNHPGQPRFAEAAFSRSSSLCQAGAYEAGPVDSRAKARIAHTNGRTENISR
jgi:hypothetical protein